MCPQLALLYLLIAWPAGAVALQDLPFMEYLDPEKLVVLKWGFDEIHSDITFKISVPTTGWIGFGFSPNGDMVNADMVVGGVGPNGNYFTDRHATGNSLPIVDSKQSYTLLSLREADGQTDMTFRRSIQSCDPEDFNIAAQPIKLIYAYGVTDDIKYHGQRRGTKEVNLLNYMPRSTVPGNTYLDVTMDNITIPAESTYYHCSVKMFPWLNVTHHVYRIEPLNFNLDVVHHMLLYGCPSFINETYDGPCYSGNIVDQCFKVIAAWGVGGGAFELPENVGIAIGGIKSDDFYRLEIHYNNPTSEAGRRDSSGLRMYYTSKLREHNAGILTTGIIVGGQNNYKIPPGATQFHTYGICNTSPFSQLVQGPVPDLQVISVFLHTHLAGRKVRAALFRDEEQVDFLAVDENYRFDFQQMKNLGNTKTIKPGDEILVECTYNTVNRTGSTQMGFSSKDEMCLAFLIYYPEISIGFCWSSPYGQVPNATEPSDQDDIIKYENLLTSGPHIQMITDDNVSMPLYVETKMRNMKATPTVICRNNHATRGMSPSCLLTLAGSVVLLLWNAMCHQWIL